MAKNTDCGQNAVVCRDRALQNKVTHRLKMSETATKQFMEFVDAGRGLLAHEGDDTVVMFREFVDQSIPEITRSIRRDLPEMLAKLRLLADWLLPIEFDLLKVAGVAGSEDAYTELVRWALNPESHPPSALARQVQWLQALGVDTSRLTEPTVPETQIWTDDGIPDLVLRYEAFTVVVEAKTGTAEHDTPLGRPQTLAYPGAIRRHYRLRDEHPIHMVFLTSDRRVAANKEAINTTYAEFCVCLVNGLEGVSRQETVRSIFALIVTHLINFAVPREVDVNRLLAALPHEPGIDLDDGMVLAHLADLVALRRIF